MRRIVLIAVGVAVVGLIAWAAMRQTAHEGAVVAQQPTREPELTSVPRTRLDTARVEIDRGSVLVIDVRDADSYIASHIPGALQIPLMRIEGEINYLPRDKPILTYCT